MILHEKSPVLETKIFNSPQYDVMACNHDRHVITAITCHYMHYMPLHAGQDANEDPGQAQRLRSGPALLGRAQQVLPGWPADSDLIRLG
jgi:hypothetical protein